MSGLTASTGDLEGPGESDASVDTGDPGSKVAQLEAELASLRKALRHRAAIEQAMGILAALHACTPEDAFRILVRLSQSYNVKLFRIARLLVQLTGVTPPAELPARLADVLRSAPADPEHLPSTADAALADAALVDAAQHVVSANEADPTGTELRRAFGDLYLLLIDRGWIAPHDVLALVVPDSPGAPAPS